MKRKLRTLIDVLFVWFGRFVDLGTGIAWASSAVMTLITGLVSYFQGVPWGLLLFISPVVLLAGAVLIQLVAKRRSLRRIDFPGHFRRLIKEVELQGTLDRTSGWALTVQSGSSPKVQAISDDSLGNRQVTSIEASGTYYADYPINLRTEDVKVVQFVYRPKGNWNLYLGFEVLGDNGVSIPDSWWAFREGWKEPENATKWSGGASWEVSLAPVKHMSAWRILEVNVSELLTVTFQTQGRRATEINCVRVRGSIDLCCIRLFSS